MRYSLVLIATTLFLSGCAIPLPYQYDQNIVDDIDEARLEVKTLCRAGTFDNYETMADQYAALISQVETTMEDARARPRRYGWFEKLQLRISQNPPEFSPALPEIIQPDQPLSCITPGLTQGYFVTGKSPESLQLAQVTIEHLRWCHEKSFDPDGSVAKNLSKGIQLVPDPRQFRKDELCRTAGDYLSDARLFEMTLKLE